MADDFLLTIREKMREVRIDDNEEAISTLRELLRKQRATLSMEENNAIVAAMLSLHMDTARERAEVTKPRDYIP